DVGLNWAATEKTNFNFYFQRAIRPSFSNTFQDFTSNGFILSFSHDLPGQFVLTGDVGYENADYFLSDPRGIQANVREDDYFRAGVAISHPCRLSQNLQGSITAFYNYNENDSTLNQSNFDQYITGLRFGLVY
ncbi:MAG: outer membrane beta-barrel protein, partial [Verrucomicrobiota bacterium]